MLLKGALVATLDPPRVEPADLRIDAAEGRIAQRGAGLAPGPGDDVVSCDGALVLPGLVNAHTHLYSALARGMPAPTPPPRSFVEVLERVWWRLDRALDAESVHLSALVGAIEAARSGTTLLVDHHSSPSFIRGSLEVLRRAVEEVGLRSVLCYEVTDRNGPEGRAAGLAENDAFLAGAESPLTRGLVGAHASFTLSEEALQELGQLVQRRGRGVHVHVAEDRADVEDAQARYGETVPARLLRHGLLTRALLAHCVHLPAADVAFVHSQGAWIAHNPRSNMNNHVGHAAFGAPARVALGTDGIDQDLLAELRAAFFKMRDAGRPDAFGAALELLAGGHRLAAALFGLPFGKLDEGGPADLVVLDYVPPTPIAADNLAGHLLFGLDRSHVRDVMVAGRWVVRERRLTTVDTAAVYAQARQAARDLWAHMSRLA
ncbi:MAG TPA: amidohydrolase family protein [Vicinamibacteria bacterium]